MIAQTRLLIFTSSTLLSLLVPSCAPVTPSPNPAQKSVLKAAFVNPHPAGSYAHFKAEPSYPKTYSVYRNEDLLKRTNASNSRVRIDLSEQRGMLMNGNTVVMDYPISSGTKKHPTPTGSYKIIERIKNKKRSNLYGKIYDASGKVINSNADTRKDTVPEGGRFEGAPMSYWMRLTGDGIGMHKGKVPRYPASHGCIRTYSKVVPTVFAKTGHGTPVTVTQ